MPANGLVMAEWVSFGPTDLFIQAFHLLTYISLPYQKILNDLQQDIHHSELRGPIPQPYRHRGRTWSGRLPQWCSGLQTTAEQQPQTEAYDFTHTTYFGPTSDMYLVRALFCLCTSGQLHCTMLHPAVLWIIFRLLGKAYFCITSGMDFAALWNLWWLVFTKVLCSVTSAF